MERNEDMDRGLMRITLELDVEPIGKIEPLACDRYLASSILQKSIRRGAEPTALRAALTLFRQDRRRLLIRLHIIALEDVGVSGAEEILSVLAALTNPVWRKRAGEELVVLYLVRLLCRATKTRIADQILSIVSRGQEYTEQREQLAWKKDQELADRVLDVRRSLPDQALALWFLAGSKRYPSTNLAERTGSLDKATEVLEGIGAPVGFTAACISILKRSQHPLGLLTPLIWSAVNRQKDKTSVLYNSVPATSLVEGLPGYGVDVFTRIGQSCYRSLRGQVSALRPFKAEQIALTVFHIEGALTDRELISPVLEHYKRAGELADLFEVGLQPPEYLGLKDCIIDNLDRLQDIRAKHLQGYVARWHEDQLFKGRT